MNFSLSKALEVWAATPAVLTQLTKGLSEEWTTNNEGEGTWSVFDVIGHLIHCDQTDWLTRAELILSDAEDKHFKPLDRFAQFEKSKGKTLHQLLAEFEQVRKANLEKISHLNIAPTDYSKTGIHPVFGVVTLSQLLAAWVVHDLDHLSQISRVMARQYKEQTGPWVAYLKIVK